MTRLDSEFSMVAAKVRLKDAVADLLRMLANWIEDRPEHER